MTSFQSIGEKGGEKGERRKWREVVVVVRKRMRRGEEKE